MITSVRYREMCLALLDDIGERGGTITIPRRGGPLASVGPVRRAAWKSPEGAWAGKVTIADDALDADTSGLWEVLRQRKGVRN